MVTGDWNNDGKTDLGLVRPTAGGQLQWFFRTLEATPKEWGTVFPGRAASATTRATVASASAASRASREA